MRSVPRPAARCALLAIACCCALPASAGATKLRAAALLTPDVNADASGNGGSAPGAVSANGRYVVFTSTASNLVDGDANGKQDVFLRDTRTGATQDLTVLGNDDSDLPAVSDDGRYVVFESHATNLVSGGSAGVYVRDVVAGSTTLVASGATAPAISGDGGTVAYWSGGLVYRTDRQNSSPAALPGPADPTLPREPPALSTDGRYVAYSANGNVYEYDANAGSATTIATGPSAHDVALSADGQRIAFASLASGTGSDDVYTRKLGDGAPTLLSTTPDGAPAGGSRPTVSGDGRYVAFESTGTNLIAGLNEQNGAADVFLRDLSTGTLMLVSGGLGSTTTTADGASTHPVLSADGRSVAWASAASNIVTPFHDGNGGAGADLYQRGIKLDPAAAIADSTESGTAPLGVDFTATSPNPGLVVDVSWDFGDGERAHGASVSHTFAAAGTFTVTATITDADGDTASASRTISVAPAQQTVVTPPDTTAPKLTLTAAKKQTLKSVLAHGLRGHIGTDENCSARMTVRISAATARSLGLGTGATTIGSARLPVAARVVTGYTVRLTKAARRQIAKHKKLRRIAISLHATGSDAAGNAAKEVVRQVLLTR